MPELPEVETTLRGIAPHIVQQQIVGVQIRQSKLRWPVPASLEKYLINQPIQSIQRRAKYLLFTLPSGTLILHLGMSGSLRVVPTETPAEKHDHVDIQLSNGQCLRLRDPRRFGAVLFTDDDPMQHVLLERLGPEPLSKSFNARYLFEKSRNRKVAVKLFLMNSHVVVGIGNIYASEALFLAGIHPKRVAGRITLERYTELVRAIKKVLRAAIKQGGTTLRDFTRSDGKPGYFRNKLNVYDREGEACRKCGTVIRHMTLGQRSTFYCPHCQK